VRLMRGTERRSVACGRTQESETSELYAYSKRFSNVARDDKQNASPQQTVVALTVLV